MTARRACFALGVGAAAVVLGCIQGPRHNVHVADTQAAAPQTAPPIASTGATTAPPSTVPGRWLGQMPPEITVDDWVGTTQPFLLRDQRGKIVLLVFCKLDDARCGPVHDQMRALKDAYAKDAFVDVELFVDQEDDAAGWQRMRDKVAALQLPWPAGVGARVEYARLRYGFSDVPAAYLIDSDGRVVWSGVPGKESTLEKAVASAVKQGP